MDRGKRYAWTRYWCDREAFLDSTEGYFPDPTSTSFFTPIEGAYELSELIEEPCLALLGEPGLGKSYTIRQAVADLKVTAEKSGQIIDFVDLGAFESPSTLLARLVEGQAWRAWTEEGKILHLFLDSLDEALLHQRSVHKLLVSTLEDVRAEIPRLRLRIACRSAEWIKELGEDLARLYEDADETWLGPIPREVLLARLRASDVELAADREGLDPKKFLRDIADRGLESLAAYPLTLSMLLDSAKEPEGIPESRTELFRRASIRLADEHSTSRRRDPEAGHLQPGQRVAVAQRIAAAVLFSGHSTIATESSRAEAGTLDIAQISGFSEEDPSAAGGAAFTVDGDELTETLRTALFVDAGSGAVQFRHRNLAEFLAASYLARHKLEQDKLVSLFVAPDDEEEKLIPQLREIAAWLAVIYPAVFPEILKRQPDVLLRVDRLSLSHEQAAQVTAALLHPDAAEAVDRWDRRLWHNLRGIDHPGLATTLRVPLGDRNAPIQVRQLAVTIARACQKQNAETDLLSLALNPDEPPYLRAHAIWALEEYASAETLKALIPLALESIPDDEDDEVKGAALQAAFPEHLGVEEVLSVLTPPRNRSLLGGYSMFLQRDFPEALKPVDLPSALRWAVKVEPEYSATDGLNHLVDAILAKAWPHLESHEIAGLFSAVVKARLSAHAGLLGSLHDESDKATFQEADGRRTLVVNLLPDITDDLAVEGKIHPVALLNSRPPLLRDEDLEWLLDELGAAIGTDREEAWASLVARAHVLEEPHLEHMFQLLEKSSALQARIKHRFEPVELNSHLAQRLRDGFTPPGDPIPEDAPVMDEEIGKALAKVERGDLEQWSQINFFLLFGPRGEATAADRLQADITELPGWQRAEEPIRLRILAAAKPYLEEIDPNVSAWLGRNVLDARASAGYRALYLLAQRDRDAFDSLSGEVWDRWAPMILDYPRSSAGDEGRAVHDEILMAAVEKAPKAVAAAAVEIIGKEVERKEGHLFLLWRLREIFEPALTEALLPKLSDESMKPQSVVDLLEWTLERETERSIELVKPRLTLQAIQELPEGREMAQGVSAVLLRKLPEVGWPITRDLMHADQDLGSAILLDVARGEAIELGGLSDEYLGEMVAAMYEVFHPEDDPNIKGAHFVSAREQAGRVRDRLLAVLVERGSNEAVEAMEALSKRYATPALRRALGMARDARRAKWRAPAPNEIVKLCVAADARLVFGDADLHRAVLASLNRIQETLQRGQPPAAPELWEGNPPTPRHEEQISDWLARRLREDLQTGGRVIDREILIASSGTGKGRGKSADIQVATPVGKFVEEADVARVLLEVKGCWNQGLESDMENQLVGRYLASSPTNYGIYIVFWFGHENWGSGDYRRGRCRGDLAERQAFFAEQAAALSEGGSTEVEAVVLDGSLPA